MFTINRPRLPLLLSAGLAGLLLTFAVACGDDDNDSSGATPQQGSESAVCGDIDSFDNAVSSVKGLGSSSSIGDITASLSSLRTSAKDLQSSLKEVKNNNADEIQAATSDLEDALTSAVSSGSVSGAKLEINDAAQDIQKDLSDAKSKANCN